MNELDKKRANQKIIFENQNLLVQVIVREPKNNHLSKKIKPKYYEVFISKVESVFNSRWVNPIIDEKGKEEVISFENKEEMLKYILDFTENFKHTNQFKMKEIY